MPIKRPAGLSLAGPAFEVDKLKAYDDHDEYHPKPKSAAEAEPVSQIMDNIFIGSVKDLSEPQKLKDAGITHILNVAKEVEMVPVKTTTTPGANANANNNDNDINDNIRQDSSEHVKGTSSTNNSQNNNIVHTPLHPHGDNDVLSDGIAEDPSEVEQCSVSSDFVMAHIPLRDGVNRNTIEVIDVAVDYVEKAVGNGGRILVHCRRGISRSAAVVVAYLMRTKCMLYQEAVKFVKERRSVISLNLEFHQTLESLCEENQKEASSSSAAEAVLAAAKEQARATGQTDETNSNASSPPTSMTPLSETFVARGQSAFLDVALANEINARKLPGNGKTEEEKSSF